MAMKIEIFDQIQNQIVNYTGLSKDCFAILHQSYPDIQKDTLHSIIAHHYQRQMKKNHYKLQSITSVICAEYKSAVRNNEPPGILVRIGLKYNFVSTAIARVILEHYYTEIEGNEFVASKMASKMIKDTTLIPDMSLAYEVYLCVLYDDQYGPISDTIRHAIGIQFEQKLQTVMRQRNIIFRDEEYLRSDGYDKTPDIKLDIPVAINGFIITWVESKALFGHPQVHEGYVKDQYLSYWNRFGPGLVIYWFGYLETIVNPNEKKFIISDKFPGEEEITLMNPQSVEPATNKV